MTLKTSLSILIFMKDEATSIEVNAEEMDTSSFIANSIKWLYDMELVTHPAVLQDLYVRVYGEDKRIVDADFLLDQNQRKMLVWIKLNWFGRLFKFAEKQSVTACLDRLQKVLPRYSFRVITDKNLFNTALERVVKGAVNEKAGTVSEHSKSTNPSSEASNEQGSRLQSSQDLLPDQKESSDFET